MKKGKNFFYRIDPEQIIAEIFPLRASERGKWLIQFLFDLRNDDPQTANSQLAKLIIEEAKLYRESKVAAGRASAKKRSTVVQQKSNGKQQRFNKIQPETETEGKEIYKEIIDDLNLRGGYRYQVSEGTNKHINARLADGFTKEDFFHVHKVKVEEWKGTDMEKYIRPQTLYLPDKFQSYLNQKPKPKTRTIKNADGEWIEVPE